ncbi:hypothetical protein FRC08_018530 [Ceratobasidium sp. 394]|nr:hypothetical protein FRC08_018530 [Ceratobasidium sp. 394]
MTEPQTQTSTEKTIRQKHTVQRGRDDHKRGIEILFQGATRPPRILAGEDGKKTSKLVSRIVDGFAAELGRQFNVCTYICAVWKYSSEVVAVTESSALVDGDPSIDWDDSATLHHFAHFALTRGGRALGIPASEAYPVPWPDFEMSGRPALPPVHPNWMQEKRNLIEWFALMWRWQGGDQEPDWEAVVQDLNKGRFEYIEKARLPESFNEFTKPGDWDEATTRVWSQHIRGTMDEWGRVLKSADKTAFQYRKIDDVPKDEEVIICEEFVDTIHPKSLLEWTTPALLFEKRVKQAMNTPAPVAEERASALYDLGADLIHEVDKSVPGVAGLCAMLREYEASVSTAATLISYETSEHSWPPAAAFISRTSDTFADNWNLDKIVYLEPFLSCESDDHHGWAVASLRDWLRKNLFWDAEAGALQSGFNGIAVAFYAIVQYGWNVARVAPKTQADEDRLFENDKAIYGRLDQRMLGSCVEIIKKQLDGCAPVSAKRLPAVDTDKLDRHSTWTPNRWVLCHTDGSLATLEREDWAVPPAHVVFESGIAGWVPQQSQTGSTIDDDERLQVLKDAGGADAGHGMDVDESQGEAASTDKMRAFINVVIESRLANAKVTRGDGPVSNASCEDVKVQAPPKDATAREARGDSQIHSREGATSPSLAEPPAPAASESLLVAKTPQPIPASKSNEQAAKSGPSSVVADPNRGLAPVGQATQPPAPIGTAPRTGVAAASGGVTSVEGRTGKSADGPATAQLETPSVQTLASTSLKDSQTSPVVGSKVVNQDAA